MSEPTADATEVREKHDVEHTDALVRQYSADGHLYAYREGDEHVVVSRGRDVGDKWTKRVPATREAVIEGEHLWTVPDNWEIQLTISGAAEAFYGVYHIPETGVDVLLSEPNKNHLVDAWYGVKRVGDLVVEYDDELDWEALDAEIDHVTELAADHPDDEILPEVIDAFERLDRRSGTFERKFEKEVTMYGDEALFRGHGKNEHPRLDGWTADPWGDIFYVDDLLDEIMRVEDDPEVADEARDRLSSAHVVPKYPTLRVDVDRRESMPDGYHVQALTEAGCSPTEALDYLMCEIVGKGQTEWAETRGKDRSTVSGSVNSAKRKLK